MHNLSSVEVASPIVTVGVIGGVGPLATTYYMEKLIRLTAAEKDQDHIDLVVMQHATIPDRTAYILGESDVDPGPIMAEDARKLESLGVAFITLPCNTAHYFVQQVINAVETPVLSIIEQTVGAVLERVSVGDKVGILATTGTLQSEVYQQALTAVGLPTLVPEEADQDLLMHIIYGQVKAGLPVDLDLFNDICDRLVGRGAEAIILGCTELSVIAEDHNLLGNSLLVDSLDVLARRTVTAAGHRLVTD